MNQQRKIKKTEEKGYILAAGCEPRKNQTHNFSYGRHKYQLMVLARYFTLICYALYIKVAHRSHNKEKKSVRDMNIFCCKRKF